MTTMTWEDAQQQYHLTPKTKMRIIETRTGILFIPLTGEPMPPELAQELAEWDAVSAGTLDDFPYMDTLA